MLNEVDASTKLIYICNPNNPRGSITPRNQIEEFIKKLPPTVYVLIDEAYHHFVVGKEGYISFIDKPIEDDRVIVGRSFSKIYGLAGMHLGYLVSSRDTIKKMKNFMAFDRVSCAVLRGAIAALNDEATILQAVKKFDKIREEFYRQTEKRKVKYISSYGNFVMLHIGERSIQSIIEHFRQNNIIIGREFPLMEHYVRISLGTSEQMEKFWKVWDKMLDGLIDKK